jgi:hypothetical protein
MEIDGGLSNKRIAQLRSGTFIECDCPHPKMMLMSRNRKHKKRRKFEEGSHSSMIVDTP